MKNNYDVSLKDRFGHQIATGVFNGDIGKICRIRPGLVTVNFDGRYADYALENLGELELSYAMTIHKAMGSEYETVIIPMLPAHKILLTRNLIYTAITRAKRRVLLVGQKKALFMAIHRTNKGKRNTLLGERMLLYYQSLAKKNPAAEAAADKKLKIAS